MTCSKPLITAASLLVLSLSTAHAQDRTPPNTSKTALQPPIDSQKTPTSTGSMVTTKKPTTASGENKQTPTGGQAGGGAGRS